MADGKTVSELPIANNITDADKMLISQNGESKSLGFGVLREYAKGDKGETGPQGPAGEGGATGERGTQWYTATTEGQYSGKPPLDAKVGDYILNGLASDATIAGWVCTPGEFVAITAIYAEGYPSYDIEKRGNIRGPQGLEGAQGPQGEQRIKRRHRG